MARFITSDTHFGHANIIKYCNRPFGSVPEMDAELVKRWNAVVGPADEVLHVGDFCFYKNPDDIKNLLKSLNGIIDLVVGNHDHDLLRHARGRFRNVSEFLNTKVAGTRAVVCHYPLLEWDGAFRGAYHLHGHCHGQFPESSWRRQDVGVDSHDYRPWAEDELAQHLNTRPQMDSSVYHAPL